MGTKKQIHVATSPLSRRIYAGYVLKDGMTWSDTNKTDVTGEACAAVAHHVLEDGWMAGEITVSQNGRPAFKIAVHRIG